MKKRYLLPLAVALWGFVSIAVAQRDLETAKVVSQDLNDQILESYEVGLAQRAFSTELDKYIYTYGYTGFMGWVSLEYVTFDDEFAERVKNADLPL